MQALPPGLYNEVYDLTFTVSPSVVHIDESYKLPSRLCVDRRSHETFAAVYYSSMVFYLTKDLGDKWAQSAF